MMGRLIVTRHSESEYNKLGIWTGTRDVPLTPYGLEKSLELGRAIEDLSLGHAVCSAQMRSLQTLECMLSAMHQEEVPIIRSAAINERDYGKYTGKNKWEMEQLVGKEAFECIRRGWDCAIPDGETLEMVYNRVAPFYETTVLPLLAGGENVLMVSHGNAIRALMMYLEQVPHTDDGAQGIEMLFGKILIYDIDDSGRMAHKDMRTIELETHA